MAASVPTRARLRGLVLAVVLALAASLLAAPAFAGQPAAAPVPRLRWVACGNGFQCATVLVPLDYDRPKGAKISLALARLPASDPAHKLGSIFLNPGGPGGSGVDVVLGAGRSLFSDAVRARFDLVGFDPRGIARSTPLRCFETLEEAFASLPPFVFPVTRAEEQVKRQSDRRIAEACERRAGPIIDHMSTANVARDMDLLRQAVGDRKLTYYGVSYGSFLGAVYANLFPDKVRAVAVDGVLDPVAWATGRGRQARTLPFTTRIRSDQGAWATLRQFFRLCDRGGDACAFSEGNPRRRYAALAERLLDEPLQIPDGQGGTFPFTYADLVGLTLGAMYDPGSWPFLAELLQELDTLSRTTTGAARVAAAAKRLRARLGAFQPEEYLNIVEGFPGVACSETDNPDRFRAWPRAAAAADRTFRYFGRLWTWNSSICLPWPGWDRDRYAGPFTRRTANPVLVIGNHYDPATSYQGAVALDRLLPRSRLLTLAGWGHTSLFLSACVDAHLNRYLLTTRVPPRGTVCEPNEAPFSAPAARTTTRAAAQRTAVIPPLLRHALAG